MGICQPELKIYLQEHKLKNQAELVERIERHMHK